MLLKNAVYLNKHMKIVNGDILISQGRIKISNIGSLDESDCHDDIIDCTDYLIIPGIINGHTHNPSTLGRGLFKDMELKDWCGESEQGQYQDQLFKILDDSVGKEEFKMLCTKAYIEYIKKGITFIVESGQADYATGVLTEAINEIGLRGIVDTYDEIDAYGGRNTGNVTYCAHIPEEEDISDTELDACVGIKRRFDVIRMTHCLETKWRRDIITEKYNKSTVQVLDEYGLLDRKAVLFHCVHLTGEDMDTIARRGSSIVYCPVSNMWSGTGITPASGWLSRDINVCLGTDFILTDIWEVMRTAYYLNKVDVSLTSITAMDIFKMATINGARALGLGKEIGLIEDGFKADLVFIKKDDTRLLPLIETEGFSTVLHNLLLECREEMIRHVMIDGKWVMKDRVLLTVDENKINAEYRDFAGRLYKGKDI